MKKRILFCSEATFLNTGYATYTREILNYLHGTGKYEVAEMSSFGQRNDPRAANIPWRYYGVMPNTDFEPKASQEELDEYHSKGTNAFGEMLFEHVCLDFMPHYVCDIRDFWMLDFAERSPFRNYFNWVIMPTVDATPQARQWISTYCSADKVLTYSDWAGTILQNQAGDKIDYVGSAPPSAHPAYKPMDKTSCRQQIGLPVDGKIIGTVMRNQRRKLYPDLFTAFNLFLEQVDNPEDYYLYCHTAYPDLGWNIPELLIENGLENKVYFTYMCPDTQQPFSSLYRGAVTQSPYTGRFGSTLSSVKLGASYADLAVIMNCFDLYVQYANSEGFGLPYVEAAACGVPIMGTDYSAMESEIRKLAGTPIQPKALYKELETGCQRAVPDNEKAAEKFLAFFSMDDDYRRTRGSNTRWAFLEKYNWAVSGQKWEECFDALPVKTMEESWCSPPRIAEPEPMPEQIPQNATHEQLTEWLIANVLREPERLNSYMAMRLTRDLMYKAATQITGGMYYNEASAAFEGAKTHQEFDLQTAYNQMHYMCSKRNNWEQQRVQVMKQRGLM